MARTKEKLANGWTRNNPGIGSSYYTRPCVENPEDTLGVFNSTYETKGWWKKVWLLKRTFAKLNGNGPWVWHPYSPTEYLSPELAFRDAEGT